MFHIGKEEGGMKVVYPTNMLSLYLIMNTSTRTIYSSLQRIHTYDVFSWEATPTFPHYNSPSPPSASGPAFILFMALSLCF